MPAPTPAEVLKDPNFQGLPVEERRKVMQKVDPNFGALPQDQQDSVVSAKTSPPPGVKSPKGTGTVTGDLARGAVAGAASTIGTLSRLNPLERASTAVERKVNPKGVAERESLQKGLETAPDTLAGKIGKGVEQAAEFLIPIPGVGEIKALGTGSKLVKAGAEMAAEAVHAIPAAAVQSRGDIKETATTAALSAAAPLFSAAAKAMAPGVKTIAGKIYESALAAPGASKVDVQKSAEGLIKNGYVAITTGKLAEKAKAQLDTAYKAIDKAVDDAAKNPNLRFGSKTASGAAVGVPPGKIEMKPIVDALEQKIKDKFMKSGAVPSGLEEDYKQYKKMLDELKSRGRFSDIRQIWELRKSWDKKVDDFEAKDLSGVKNAMRDASHAVRTELSKWIPEMRKPNAEYSFWAGVRDVATAKEKSGIGKIEAALGGGLTVGAGEMLARGVSAEEAAMLAAIGAVTSMPGRMMTAIGMDRFGNALSGGRAMEALRLLSIGAAGTPSKPTSPPKDDSKTSPPPQ